MGFCQSFHLKPLRDLIHDAEEVGDGLGTEHCYTGLLEITDAFEEGGGGGCAGCPVARPSAPHSVILAA